VNQTIPSLVALFFVEAPDSHADDHAPGVACIVAEPTKNTRRATAATTTTTTDLQQATRSRMQNLARLVGNDEITKRIEQGSATREQMLAFVASQLGEIRDLQTRELDLLGATSVGPQWTRFADGNQQIPAPERWKGPAEAYQSAVEALCGASCRAPRSSSRARSLPSSRSPSRPPI
jgi:hypothetical protein